MHAAQRKRRMHEARVKILGGPVVLGGDNVSPLVEIGLTDPPKSRGAAAPPASHLAACLRCINQLKPGLLKQKLVLKAYCHKYCGENTIHARACRRLPQAI